jgi:hypothetical protein
VSADVLSAGPELESPRQPAIGVLGRKEAWRILRSPAFPMLLGYLVFVFGIDSVRGGNESASLFQRNALADTLAFLSLMTVGPLTFVAAHLVASSARRSGSERLLAAMPLDRRRRDLALCLGVLPGVGAVALAISGASAWLASDGETVLNGDTARWSWIDVAQVPAIVLGAGVLGVVVARWLPYPGSCLLGFVAMVFGTAWLMDGNGPSVIRPWLAPYVVIEWWSENQWIERGSQPWHLAYLLALSALGVCAVALRHPERRGRWLAGMGVAAAVVVVTGLLQLPLAAAWR